MQLAQQNALLLKTLKKTRAGWTDENEFFKIVNKLESGKNLKKDEFDVIHQILFQ